MARLFRRDVRPRGDAAKADEERAPDDPPDAALPAAAACIRAVSAELEAGSRAKRCES
ncbi:MAG: hypothetical protein ABSA03_22975 [Streptosporangiaceae bacterium]|jgi:hypothetical protein